MKSVTRGEIIVAEFPDGQKVLYVQIRIDCPECGPIFLQIPGHHLRALRDLAIEAIDNNPDLCGMEAGKEVTRTTFGGKPNDPSTS